METTAAYVDGFNTGYLLKKYEFSLLDKLLKNPLKINDFFQGFFDGSVEYELEKQIADLNQIRKGGIELDKDFII